MSKDSKYKETRKQLIEISNIAKKLREAEALEMTINEILLKIIYDTKEVKEFNTFNQWKERGYTIIKGSKAFLIWGQPVNKQKKDKAKEQGKEPEEGDEYEYFPVCYLFSDKQVYKKEATPEETDTEEVTEPETVQEPEYLPL